MGGATEGLVHNHGLEWVMKGQRGLPCCGTEV